MSRHLPVWAEIDLGHLRHNFKTIRRHLTGPKVEVLAVVKADAYGHGMKRVARALYGEGVRFFGVANIDEALELRKNLPSARILVLGSFHHKQIPLFVAKRITPTLCSAEDLKVLERFLKKKKMRFPVHVKIDTGMGRLGVWHENAEDFFSRISPGSAVEIEGVYTHFSSADKKDKSVTQIQIRRFNSVVNRIGRLGFFPRYLHAANSMGAARFRAAHFNLVRPGILLYGIHPGERGISSLGLRPVLALKSRIAFLKHVGRGRSLSYGQTHVTNRPTRIATLPVGYSHGYRVGFSNRSFVILAGKKCPVVGRVTMDQTLVDVGRVPAAKRWDEVVLIGQSGPVGVTARELAEIAQTIPYEIVCSIHSRIPRVYKDLKNVR
jgi:alanine racemase